MMLPVLSELSELYRAADGAATACLLAKLGVEKCLMAKLEDTRQALLVGRPAALGVLVQSSGGIRLGAQPACLASAAMHRLSVWYENVCMLLILKSAASCQS